MVDLNAAGIFGGKNLEQRVKKKEWMQNGMADWVLAVERLKHKEGGCFTFSIEMSRTRSYSSDHSLCLHKTTKILKRRTVVLRT